jgi:hypothetical protein
MLNRGCPQRSTRAARRYTEALQVGGFRNGQDACDNSSERLHKKPAGQPALPLTAIVIPGQWLTCLPELSDFQSRDIITALRGVRRSADPALVMVRAGEGEQPAARADTAGDSHGPAPPC